MEKLPLILLLPTDLAKRCVLGSAFALHCYLVVVTAQAALQYEKPNTTVTQRRF
jgi:hypothetical protein